MRPVAGIFETEGIKMIFIYYTALMFTINLKFHWWLKLKKVISQRHRSPKKYIKRQQIVCDKPLKFFFVLSVSTGGYLRFLKTLNL